MMDKKKVFAEPVCEVICFEVEDVIAASLVSNDWDTDAFAFDNQEQSQ